MANSKTAVIMVGLPARGKTFLSVRLQRYLEWQGYRVRIFNVGSYRRGILGLGSSGSDFFDPGREEFARERERIAKRCFGDFSEWLAEAGDIAIYDATNVTPARRVYLRGECLARGFDHIFVENICDDPAILDKIISVKIGKSADYRGMDPASAKEDFLRRIRHYESVYETVDENLPHVQIFNFGERVRTGFEVGNLLFGEMAEFLGSVNLAEKTVYLTRHGETYYNVEDRIGGDSPLTGKGVGYARRLGDFFKNRDLVVFTSAKRRAVETAAFFPCEKFALEELNEINSGVCDGLSYEEIDRRYPEISYSRRADKFNFRYPKGESYRDLIQRVKRAVVKIESQRKDVLVIGHRAVNRCLFSYFMPTLPEKIPYIDMPLNRVIRIYHQRALYNYESLPV